MTMMAQLVGTLAMSVVALMASGFTPVAAATAAAGADPPAGTGCEKVMSKVCPTWKTDMKQCEACVRARISRLEPNCTLKQALKHCENPPPAPTSAPIPPQPPAPPTPPVEPRPGAPRPHIVLAVIDDMGHANIGYNNKENVHTPTLDELASQGVILESHYAFRWCAPTRSALMTGRLPYHVLEETNYVTRGMTMMPAKLQQVGYETHQIGKWHLGATAPWMLPARRGFNTSLGFLSGAEDHYHQNISSKVTGCSGVDLVDTDRPAFGVNGTYGSFIYAKEAERRVRGLDPSKRLFMYLATQVLHAPQEVPDRFSALYPAPKYSPDYAIMNGMASAADEIMRNVTGALKDAGLWNDTLLIVTSDNGGPAGLESSGHSGNNFPLRGGKTNNFQGGIRVNSFISGGWLPQHLRGTTRDQHFHVADWYRTVCWLAGVDSDDTHPGIDVPPVDGFNMWPYLSGENATSPRTEFVISSESNGGIVQGDWKLIQGVQSYGFWQGPNYPNASTDRSNRSSWDRPVDCGEGCLFNIKEDPSEYVDLAQQMPQKLQAMQARYRELNASVFRAPKEPQNKTRCEEVRDSFGGYLFPYQPLPSE